MRDAKAWANGPDEDRFRIQALTFGIEMYFALSGLGCSLSAILGRWPRLYIARLRRFASIVGLQRRQVRRRLSLGRRFSRDGSEPVLRITPVTGAVTLPAAVANRRHLAVERKSSSNE